VDGNFELQEFDGANYVITYLWENKQQKIKVVCNLNSINVDYNYNTSDVLLSNYLANDLVTNRLKPYQFSIITN
jgi:hypothetical protein